MDDPPKPLPPDEKTRELTLRYVVHLMVETVEVKTLLRTLISLERERAEDKGVVDAMYAAAERAEQSALSINLRHLRERLDPTSIEMELLDALGDDEAEA